MIDLNALPFSGGRASLLEALAAVSDPRKKRGIRHQIAATLTMVAAAGLSGCGRSFRSVGDFVADMPQEALARLGARYHPVRRCYIAPDAATIRRHVKMIDADQADAAVGGWLLAQVAAGRPAAGDAAALTMVALDGKVLPLLDDIAAARCATGDPQAAAAAVTCPVLSSPPAPSTSTARTCSRSSTATATTFSRERQHAIPGTRHRSAIPGQPRRRGLSPSPRHR